MIVLSPSTPMMIKKKMNDTARKNVARSSVIMMISPFLLHAEEPVHPNNRADGMKTTITLPNLPG
jgi:hypothetical protein